MKSSIQLFFFSFSFFVNLRITLLSSRTRPGFIHLWAPCAPVLAEDKVSMWWSLEAALLTVGVACRHISAALALIGIWTRPWVGVSSTPPGSVSLLPAAAIGFFLLNFCRSLQGSYLFQQSPQMLLPEHCAGNTCAAFLLHLHIFTLIASEVMNCGHILTFS